MPRVGHTLPLVLAILGLAAGPALCNLAPDAFPEAMEALAGGDTVDGERLLLQAISRDPAFGPARYELGLLRRFVARDPEGARSHLQAALTLGLPPGDADRARFVLAGIETEEWDSLLGAGRNVVAMEAFLARWPATRRRGEAEALIGHLLADDLERAPDRVRAEALAARFGHLPAVSDRIRLVLLRLRLADLVRTKDPVGLDDLAREAAGTPLAAEAAGVALASRVWLALQGTDAGAITGLLSNPEAEPHRAALARRLAELTPPPAPQVPPAEPATIAEAAPKTPEAPGQASPEPATAFTVPVAGTALTVKVGEAEVRGAGVLKATEVYRPRLLLLVGNDGPAPLATVAFRGTLREGRGRVVEVREADLPGPFDPPLLPGEEPRALELLFTKGSSLGLGRDLSFQVSLELSPDRGESWIPAGAVLLAGTRGEGADLGVKVTLRPTPPAAAP